MSNERAEKLADAVWTRLLARGCMIVFGLVGSVGVPTGVVYLRETSKELRALDKNIDALRAAWTNDQTADAGRFTLLDSRVVDHERRLQLIEGRRLP